MADYQAKSTSSLSFDLTQNGGLIGKLSYKSWFTFHALVEMANHPTYQLEPKGFWGTTIELKEADNRLLTFTMNWDGDIVLQTYFNRQEKGYLFKHRGIFKESFVLIDQDSNELLVMKPELKWKNLTYDYQLTTADRFESLARKELFLLTCLHCANYYVFMIANVAGA
ncbi:hypothetical protein LZD49_20300 [Dyadobacter sp. CY261]|uniref:hypothetical protein n=1 Tax=Dyadobacter sp. CY261 TaxID=2907203 RepID=UPI001F2C9701|nr:hypothetical protein [Dyadobacter sp. CY261]MCF0072833.1 hypothetical protein [Dyadobacter sp. CY261]